MEAYAISVAARLEDDVTPGLLRIIDTLKAANDAMLDFTANVRNLSRLSLSIGRNMEKAAAGATAFSDASAGLTRASYVLDTMAASSADLARNMTAARAAGAGMGRGGIALSASRASHHGIAAKSAEGAGIATLGFVGYGIYQNAKLQDAITRAVMTDNTPPALQAAAAANYMRRIREEAPKYGFAAHGLGDFANAYLSASRLLRGMDTQTRMGILDTILPFAAQEAFLKKISLTESLSAFVGAAHMAGAYTAPEIRHILPALISTSMATNASMSRIENAAGYAAPILRTSLGIDPAQVFTMIALMQRAGIQNSKSGTWLADLFMNAQPGNFGAGLFKSTKQTRALTALGLLEGHKLTYLNPNGTVNAIHLLVNMEKRLQAMAPTMRALYLKQAFGAQGARAAALLDDPRVFSMIPMLEQTAKHLESPAIARAQALQNNPAMQAKQTLTNAQLTITNATATFMGPVNAALSAAAPASAKMASFAHDNPMTALGLGAAGSFFTLMAGKSAWALGKLAVKDMGALTERLVLGAAERVTGAAIGEGAATYLAAGSGAIAALGVTVAGATGYALGKALSWAIDEAIKRITSGKEQSLGGWIYDLTHPAQSHSTSLVQQMVQRAGAGPGKNWGGMGAAGVEFAAQFVPPARSQMVEVHHKTILNGKVLADEVSWHLGKQLARPPAGPNQALFGLTPSSPATTAAIR